MPRIRLRETVPYSAEQMYNLVVDVPRYPEFLPWCVETKKFDVEETQFMAELTVAFKGIRQSFQTLDKIVPNKKISIALTSGPFRNLTSEWQFTAIGDTRVRVDFFIDFTFSNRILNMTVGPVFTHAAKQMVSAFRKRANQLYN